MIKEFMLQFSKEQEYLITEKKLCWFYTTTKPDRSITVHRTFIVSTNYTN